MNWMLTLSGLLVILLVGVLLLLSQVVSLLHDLQTQRDAYHKETLMHLNHLCESANHQENNMVNWMNR